MTDWRDGEWRLGYSATSIHPGADLLFGREDSGIYCLNEPSVAFSDGDVADAELPGEDGVRMGRDYQRSMTVTFDLGVDGVDRPVDRHGDMRPWAGGFKIGEWRTLYPVPGMPAKRPTGDPYQWGSDGVDLLRQAWRADAVRGRAGGVAWLRRMSAGRARMVYGRPRKFAVGKSDLTRQGYTPVVAEFVAIDDRFYDDTESSEELYDRVYQKPQPRPGRPAVGRFESKKTAKIAQKGRVATHPYLKIHGPCKNPKVTFAGLWAVQLSMEIKGGEYVQIDPRPWARSVMHYKGSSSSSVADRLTRSSPRLAEMLIPPGSWTASLSASSPSGPTIGGPLVEIIWRNAFAWW
ncbi:hypothetical protein [Streptomyces similanensis]|uniref:Uncharacterized protein n=1 Tax=Streptomyces similanensis TaxID=1274988 RepID=A0ABP9L885_9ACTN